MKAKLLIVPALVLCACNPVRTDLEKFDLNCKAAEVTLQSDSLEFPYTARFNADGQITTMTTRNFDGSERYVETYTYNSRKEISEVSGVNADNETEARYEYEIDGRFVRECRVYGMNNQEIHRWVHQNDGKHIVHTEYYGEGELEYVTTKSFKGSHYTEESVNPDGELLGKAEVDFFRNENKPSRITGEGLDVEISYNEKGLPVMSRNVVLNSLGEMQWVPDLLKNPCRWYSYVYDERGNWISRAESIHPDSTARAVLYRTIVY